MCFESFPSPRHLGGWCRGYEGLRIVRLELSAFSLEEFSRSWRRGWKVGAGQTFEYNGRPVTMATVTYRMEILHLALEVEEELEGGSRECVFGF